MEKINMDELLSIIVPIYNVEKYLDRCIRSLVIQRYSNIEIILVDDGSPDKCPTICESWAKKDPRIKVIHKKNGGLSDARNRGVEEAKGTYITFVDSDDFVDKEMYYNMISAMHRCCADISICSRYIYNNETEEKRQVHYINKEIILHAKEAIGELLCGGIIDESVCDKVFRKKLFNDIRFPYGEINEDAQVMPLLFRKAQQIVCIESAYYYYCINPYSITHGNYNSKKHVYIEHINSISKYISDNYPELDDELKIFKGRYAISQLLSFVQNPALKKKYWKDFQIYKEIFNNCWKSVFLYKCTSINSRIEIICLRMGIYYPVWKMKHLLKRIIKINLF